MPVQGNGITALFPGLLGPQPELPRVEPGSRPDLGPLETLLSRAVMSSTASEPAGQALDRELGRVLEIPVAARRDFPWAALGGIADGLDTADGWWLRLDPVYLQLDRDALYLLASDELHLSREQSDALVTSLNAHFREQGWHIHAPHPQRWYLRLDQPADIHTTSLYAAFGHDVHTCLPAGPDQRRWHGWLNECQMLLAGHPVNAEREARAQMPVNSIWPWGGGMQPPSPDTAWRVIVADEPALQGWARLQDIPCRSLAEGLPAGETGSLLLMDSACNEARQLQDVYAWFDCASHLQRQYIVPLLARLRAGTCQTLTLLDGDGRRWELTPRRLRSWWRGFRSGRRPIERFLLPAHCP
ncbi:MAG TPA: hypothetical protein EYP40_07435 [Chromatiales bacterium]|nr:hypothetical protein [Chromatiales bacterium]